MTARERLKNRRSHEVFAVEHGTMKFTAGMGRFPDGRLAELFITTNKLGTGVGIARSCFRSPSNLVPTSK